jgi:dipeptidyl aminopeptidase/acylaminoacyl peptidase
MHPLTIAASRQRAYPGSDILIEQTLSPGVNYDRFIVSYLSDGLKIYALMTVPHGEKPRDGWPAVVFNHGYILPAQYRTTERYVAYVDAFARNGYIVFKSDYRGHGLSEGEPRSYGFPDYTTDVLNAVASVKRYTQIDPDRIGMYGHSMGGYLTLRAMVITKDIKAGAIWAGVVGSYADIAQMWFNTPTAGSSNAGEQNWVQAFYSNIGTPASNPTFWDAISANTYAADLSGPVQLQHARTDTHVPITMSDQLAEQIRVVGGSVEYFKYDVDDHNLTSNLGIALSRTLAFFDKTLKR